MNDILTMNAYTTLTQANKIAYYKGQKSIKGEDIFLGTYISAKSKHIGEIFCNIIGIEEEILEKYVNTEREFTNTQDILGIPTLTLSKNIYTQITKYVNQHKRKIGLMGLLYLSISNISPQFLQGLKKQGINQQKIIKNCEKILQNPIISQHGLFAFLEILGKIFKKMNLDPKQIKTMKIKNIKTLDNLTMLLDAVDKDVMENKGNNSVVESAKQNKKEDKKLTIEYFGTDLTREIKDGFIDPIIGREDEINQMIYTLLRKNKNNPLLIGEAGVGKTAIVEGLAQKIVEGKVPEKLKNKKLFSLDMGTVIAGTKYRGEFEARMKTILEEAMDVNNNIILFIDEIHTIIGAGGQENNDAAQMIKPLLSRGKLKLIGATTFNEYQKHIEKDAALKRRFQEIIVNEPDGLSTQQIMIGLKQTYEDFHGVQITPEAIDYSIVLSKRYILNKHLPDKALDLIDEACARKSTMAEKLEHDENYQQQEQRISDIQKKIEEAIEKQDYFAAAELKDQEEEIKKEMQKIRSFKNIPTHLRPIITKEDIGNVLAYKLGIPSNIINESEIEKLKRLQEKLTSYIVGQDEAVESIVKTITRSRLSVIEKTKPIGSFLFLGPSGVGKTYLAKLIAKEYFGDEKSLIRYDMSEYMEKYSVSKLIGSPAGYVGYDESGNLTEEIRRKPYSVVLFDEIEKAAPDVLNILLQILDEGQLKDNKGRLIDFKSTIIIMTSNIGSEEFSKKQSSIGFETVKKTEVDKKFFESIKERVLSELKNYLSPELINRIDYKIVFRHLDKTTLAKIFKSKVNEFLTSRKNNAEAKLPSFTDKKINDIIEKIYDPQYGARPIERYIHDTIEPEIINKLLNK